MKWPVGLIAIFATLAGAQNFSERVQAIVSRPEYRHSRFGVAVLALDTGKTLYHLNSQQLFVPGSTTKLLSEGIALTLLGPDYRFHTRVYRTGALDRKGKLAGDLVILAGGDPNLSSRIQPDGTLAFRNVDHSYSSLAGAEVVPGDPLAVMRDLARQVSAKGIRKIGGRVRVDVGLFPEGQRELGTGVVLSPMMLNDNVIDVIVTPALEGEPASIEISPNLPGISVINRTRTGSKGSQPDIDITGPGGAQDSSNTIVVAGTLPPGKAVLRSAAVESPSEFAASAFVEALRREGVELRADAPVGALAGPHTGAKYEPEFEVAEHVSPPFDEEVKVTLKVSQNLHAGVAPFLIGALVAGKSGDAAYQAGFDRMREYLQRADLDITGAAQSDGAGGDAYFTPDFMVRYLEYMSKQSFFPVFYRALPVLGRDGTLWDIQPDSPAAGHVHAKTGTYASYNALGQNLMVTGKGLAGFVERRDGRRVAIAVYANMIAGDPATITHHVGDALGEIAAAAWDANFE